MFGLRGRERLTNIDPPVKDEQGARLDGAHTPLMPHRQLHLAVITVTYRGGDCSIAWANAIQNAWQVVAREQSGSLRTIAVDNASGDGTPERLKQSAPWVEVIKLGVNRGFAAGCNVGCKALNDEDLIVFLNPDVCVSPDFFSVLSRLDWPEGVAAVGPQILGATGEVEQSARGFPRASTGAFGRTALLSRVLSGSRLAQRDLMTDASGGPRDVDWVSGACLITRSECLASVGGFDENYFMYWEDADWCRRAHDLGLRVRYQPELLAHHAQGSCSGVSAACEHRGVSSQCLSLLRPLCR